MKRALFAAAVAALLAIACGSDDTGSSSGGSSSGSIYSTEQKAGIATYYDADGSGSCSYDASDDLDVVALNLEEFAGSASCGSCIRVQGAKGSVTVRVTDSCPPCGHHHMDLSAQAFAKIDDPEKGRVDITYQTVPCDVKGNMSYHYKDGSSQYWTAIQVRNHRVPIAKLELKKNGAYVDVPRTDYNYFVDEQGAGDQKSLAIRVTAADGQVVEDTIPGGIEENATHDGTVQFR